MNSLQTSWTVPSGNVVGHSRDPLNGKIDYTEGFGAFDSILDNYSLGRRCVDIGGGQHDCNSAYCSYKYLIDISVIDPFMRTKEHNRKVLRLAEKRPFDSCTSISVLNVINLQQDRIEHIKLCKSVIRECGKVFFKVWPGNGSGIGQVKGGYFQSNRNLDSYLKEIESIFGSDNVKMDKENKIVVAVKNNP
jgi:hypothetical protein